MKINEVESLVGITKKNIRFYEDQGLLCPRRNGENGYRDYGDEEVETLRRIKLLRKLGVPLEEIRKMQQGIHTVGDGMRRHLVTLEREKESITQSMELCIHLCDLDEKLDQLDADKILTQMERLEQSGATFSDQQHRDTKKHFLPPIIAACVMVGLMIAIEILFVWSSIADAADAPPLPVMILFLLAPIAVIVGVLLALKQRVGEIEKGEAEDARKY